MIKTLLILSLFFSTAAQAYLPPGFFLLQKITDNSAATAIKEKSTAKNMRCGFDLIKLMPVKF
jgi:hypothetical protein